MGVAIRRAAHQRFDHPVVFQDPLAERIIGDTGRASLSARPGIWSQPLRAFVVARGRFAEDELALAYARGVRQYVVLGAGLDTFAYRNPFSPSLRVFEIDHPATQAWKRHLLTTAAIAIPDSVTFVPVDFETQQLAQSLANAPGFDPTTPAFFSLLGVVPYLTREAFLTTVRTVAAMPPGSGIVFDYGLPPSSLNWREQLGLKILSHKVARLGESFRLRLDPHELTGILRDLAFSEVNDLGQAEINHRYFQNRTDGLRIRGNAGHLLRAR
jgi:methyltransferase (TIGR00027 family)